MSLFDKLSDRRRISPYQFVAFRVILGCYLMAYFAHLIPIAQEIPGACSGANEHINPLFWNIPNLPYWLSASQLQGLLVVLSILSLAFAFGILRQILSPILAYFYLCLIDNTFLDWTSETYFVSWILILLAFVPRGEPLVLFKTQRDGWHFPHWIYWIAWILLLGSSTYRGIDHLGNPLWRDGQISVLLNHASVRYDRVQAFVHVVPSFVLTMGVWSVLLVRILSLPMLFHQRSRKVIWLLLLFMHLVMLIVLECSAISIGGLILLMLTFDGTWLKPRKTTSQILFFDGVCGLCNSTVDLLMTEDHAATLKFAALQGETARTKLEPHYIDDLDSMVYLRDEMKWTKSSGVLRALRDVGGFWRVFYVFILIPKPLRDALYSFVGKNRYRWFGKTEACRMPTKEERERLLT